MLDLMGTLKQSSVGAAAAEAANNGVEAESTPLLPSNASGDSAVGGQQQQQQYYFLGKANNDYQGGTSSSVRDEDGGEIYEDIPEGSQAEEFAPKQLAPIGTPTSRRQKSAARTNSVASNNNNNNSGGGFWSKLFGGGGEQQRPSAHPHIGEVGTMVKPRKAPIKVEPKVFFANERTFLAWMHLSVTLAGASIAILAFAEDQNPFSQLYGVLLLPVAIAFIVYSMYQYSRRATMIRHRNPGPYEDTVGPAVLGIMLMVSIVAQFALKLYAMAE